MIRLLRRFCPRLIRLQFSLSSLFLLTTTAAAGTWYWYQLPYPVERWVGSLYPICTTGLTQPLPNNYREVQYYRRVHGGEPIEHGRYLGYDAAGNLLRTGYYRNGKAHGNFVDYSATGRKLRQSTLVNGQTQGVCHEWDLGGNLVETANYRDGQLHGTMRRWDSAGRLEREVNYDHSVHHGPFDHRFAGELCVQGAFERDLPCGQWTWFPYGNDTATIRGQWRSGRPDGRWEWKGADGRVYLTAEFQSGRLISSESDLLSPRVICGAVNCFSTYDPASLGWAFGPRRYPPSSETLKSVIARVAGCLSVPWYACEDEIIKQLHTSGVPTDAVVATEMQNEPLLIRFAKTLKPLGLGYDLRHGAMVIDRLDSIVAWCDYTGVSELDLSPGSELSRSLQTTVLSGVIDMRFGEFLSEWSHNYRIAIDGSLVPLVADEGNPLASQETLISMELKGVTVRRILGMVLERVHCKVSLHGETLVIKPQ